MVDDAGHLRQRSRWSRSEAGPGWGMIWPMGDRARALRPRGFDPAEPGRPASRPARLGVPAGPGRGGDRRRHRGGGPRRLHRRRRRARPGRRDRGRRRRVRRRHRRDGAAGPAPGSSRRPPGGGKGQAMARGRWPSTDGELIVFLDADVEHFSPHFVIGLLGPLLPDEDVALVKGFYERPLHGEPSGGWAGHRAHGATGDRPLVPPSRRSCASPWPARPRCRGP